MDLTPVDDERSVSRRHARLVRSPIGHWTVRDLGSANGTAVDGIEMADGEEHSIGDGAGLRFGDVVLVFRMALPWPEGLRPGWEDHTATERFGADPKGTVFGRRPPPEAEPAAGPVARTPWHRRLFGERTPEASPVTRHFRRRSP